MCVYTTTAAAAAAAAAAAITTYYYYYTCLTASFPGQPGSAGTRKMMKFCVYVRMYVMDELNAKPSSQYKAFHRRSVDWIGHRVHVHAPLLLKQR